MSALRLHSIQGTRVNVMGVDILDGTPLLDIKPYVPDFDAFRPSRAGWFDRVAKAEAKADSRFDRHS
jgi:tRNA (adenine37-N6)-methyltransferase